MVCNTTEVPWWDEFMKYVSMKPDVKQWRTKIISWYVQGADGMIVIETDQIEADKMKQKLISKMRKCISK